MPQIAQANFQTCKDAIFGFTCSLTNRQDIGLLLSQSQRVFPSPIGLLKTVSTGILVEL